jgi:hypothetical protein
MPDPGLPISKKRLCGRGDEAGFDLAAQIAVHQSLGWEQLELRNIGGKPIGYLDRNEIGEIKAMLDNGKICMPVLDSCIGN